MSERPDVEGLGREVGEIWDRNAEYWDFHMGEGNAFHSELVQPSQERLLDLHAGDLVLDVACGNGPVCEADGPVGSPGRGVRCIPTPARMIELARGRTSDDTGQIEYSVMDATDEKAIDALGKERFDAAVCTMAMMDMPTIEPIVSALGRVLKPGGRFVFSVSHPCFNSEATTMLAEDVVSEGRRITQYSVRISEYIRPATRQGEAMRGQPALQYYFERPLSRLFKSCFDAGFVLDGLEEPVFSEPGSPGVSLGETSARSLLSSLRECAYREADAARAWLDIAGPIGGSRSAGDASDSPPDLAGEDSGSSAQACSSRRKRASERNGPTTARR